MKFIHPLLACCVLLWFATGCRKTSSVTATHVPTVGDYTDSIVKPHHWTGSLSQWGPAMYTCCNDTFNLVFDDTVLRMSRNSDSLISIANLATLQYSSMDSAAHTVTYSYAMYTGYINPYTYSLVYYYLADSAVLSYRLSQGCCGVDFFYTTKGMYTTFK